MPSESKASRQLLHVLPAALLLLAVLAARTAVADPDVRRSKLGGFAMFTRFEHRNSLVHLLDVTGACRTSQASFGRTARDDLRRLANAPSERGALALHAVLKESGAIDWSHSGRTAPAVAQVIIEVWTVDYAVRGVPLSRGAATPRKLLSYARPW